MTNIPISALPSATAANGADIFPVVQGGTTKKMTLSVSFSMPPAIGSLTPNTGAFTTVTAGAASSNKLTLAGAGGGSGPTISATGSDTDIDMRVVPKGDGVLETLLARVGTINDAPSQFKNLPTFQVVSNPVFAGAVTPSFQVNSDIQGTATGQVFFNGFAINNDVVDTLGAAGGGGTGLYIGHNLSSGAKGGRSALLARLTQSATTHLDPLQYYVAVAGQFVAAHSAGGSLGDVRGAVAGMNPYALLQTGSGLYWDGIAGMEIDVGVETGVGVLHKFGLTIIQLTTDAVQGTTDDAGIGIVNQPDSTAPGWKVGISFGADIGWWPVSSTGTLIGTSPSNGSDPGPSYACATGIDWSAVAFSTAFLKSVGFTVDGLGNTTAKTFSVGTGGPAWAAGTGAPGITLPKGSMYSRTDGGVGTTLYVSQGGGTWNPVLGV
jgi:hypothetical protein